MTAPFELFQVQNKLRHFDMHRLGTDSIVENSTYMANLNLELAHS